MVPLAASDDDEKKHKYVQANKLSDELDNIILSYRACRLNFSVSAFEMKIKQNFVDVSLKGQEELVAYHFCLAVSLLVQTLDLSNMAHILMPYHNLQEVISICLHLHY